jgi:hypothetical protein
MCIDHKERRPNVKKTDYYVYVYIDPRDLKPFYYGMGS